MVLLPASSASIIAQPQQPEAWCLHAGKPLPEAKPNTFADVLGSMPAAFKKVDKLEVPAKYMAQVPACPKAQSSDKGHVEAIFIELPKDVTSALIKRSAATQPTCCLLPGAFYAICRL